MKRIIAILAAILILATPATFSETIPMTVIVVNAAPTLDNIKINDVDSGATVSPTAGTTTTVTVYAEATDGDGWGDISSIVCTVTGTSAVTGSPVSLSLSTLDTDTAQGTGTVTMDFHDVSGTYSVDCVADDGATTGNLVETYTYDSLTALDLDVSTVGFGNVGSGATSTVTGSLVQNYGNVVIDAEIIGTDLTGTATITVDNVDYRFGAVAYDALSTSTQGENIDLAVAETSTTNVDFELTVPVGTASGTYTGSVTITAVVGSTY